MVSRPPFISSFVQIEEYRSGEKIETRAAGPPTGYELPLGCPWFASRWSLNSCCKTSFHKPCRKWRQGRRPDTSYRSVAPGSLPVGRSIPAARTSFHKPCRKWRQGRRPDTSYRSVGPGSLPVGRSIPAARTSFHKPCRKWRQGRRPETSAFNEAELARVQRRYVNRPNPGEFGYTRPLRRYVTMRRVIERHLCTKRFAPHNCGVRSNSRRPGSTACEGR